MAVASPRQRPSTFGPRSDPRRLFRAAIPGVAPEVGFRTSWRSTGIERDCAGSIAAHRSVHHLPEDRADASVDRASWRTTLWRISHIPRGRQKRGHCVIARVPALLHASNRETPVGMYGRVRGETRSGRYRRRRSAPRTLLARFSAVQNAEVAEQGLRKSTMQTARFYFSPTLYLRNSSFAI